MPTDMEGWERTPNQTADRNKMAMGILQNYEFVLQLGEAQTFKNITVLPLHTSRNG
jgi:hypothetical protein